MKYMVVKMNISEATRKALGKYPYLDRYMSMGIINNRGLARHIHSDVSKHLETQPNIQSIVTALRRLSQKKRKTDDSGLENILAKSTVNLKYDTAAATISVGQSQVESVKKRILTEGTYILLQGMESLTIVADNASIDRVRDSLGSEVLEIYSDLAIVVVKSPGEITTTPGVLAYLANILALEGINIVEMMSSHAETAFIVDEKDALITIEVLRREIKRSRTRI
jgi:predicted regulator of amino acid metabolism with ACT domain